MTAENADVLYDDNNYYAIIKNVGMSADPNVGVKNDLKSVKINTEGKIKNVKWLDNGKAVKTKNNSFEVVPFAYGTSRAVRVARFTIEK